MVFIAPDTNYTSAKSNRTETQLTDSLLFPYIGKISKQTDVMIFLLEGVSESHFTSSVNNNFNKKYPNWKIENFFISMPHSSKSIYTLLTGKLQIHESRPKINDNDAKFSLPKHFQNWGYQTSFYTSQPLIIENLEQISETFFMERDDQISLSKKFPSFSSFSWGIDDAVLLDRITLDLNVNKPLFSILYFSNTHSPYFVSDRNSFLLGDKSDSFSRFKAALNYNFEIIEQIINLVKKERNRDTLFIIISDHGESFGERNFHHHNYSLYDSETKVPAIFIYNKDLKQRIFHSGAMKDFKLSLLSLFESNNSNSNFFTLGYKLKLLLKSWNSDAYLGIIEDDKKLIFHKENNRLFELDLMEFNEKELTDNKDKFKFMDQYTKLLNQFP
ncbi:MAG: sulfatase-like hydrolase/transferase [Leptospira sp.]|nr:sulfatase-like hydrolase/transferase [Leptospira sp.]